MGSTSNQMRTAPPNKIVLASTNAGKLAELRLLLTPIGISLISIRKLGLNSPAETGSTFVENALIKARHAATETGLASIADDSGLVVPALGGAPGLRSSRYAGEHATADNNNKKLLEALRDINEREAYFYCALVLLTDAKDPVPIIATATWRGTIIDNARGSRGFGYDPYFWVSELNLTAAELDRKTKNAISHRGQAFRQLIAKLQIVGHD